MSLDRAINLLGMVLLLLCFGMAASRILMRDVRALVGKDVTIRFAHFELEVGVREALDSLARTYEREHPHVNVEQIAVPQQFYKQWIRTQLVGGIPPDIIEVQRPYLGDEMKARFLIPMTRLLAAPNPYNKGSDLETEPWRNTFIDGVSSSDATSNHLLEAYGVPMTLSSERIYYNKRLLCEITGRESFPLSFEDFFECAREIQDYAKRTERFLFPVAGSTHNSIKFFNDLFGTQTQQLAFDLSLLRDLGRSEQWNLAVWYLEGRWDVRNEPVQLGLELVRDLSLLMQPGFFQQRRDDAVFFFGQERALMIAAGSQDAQSLIRDIPFEVGIAPLPFPAPDDPRFGRYFVSRPSEIERTLFNFGIVRTSRHRGEALDFLQFLTSRSSNQEFVKAVDWLPAVVGVTPGEFIEPFMPFLDGSVPYNGFDLDAGSESRQVFLSYLHLLVGKSGSVAAFTEAYETEIGAALERDIIHNYEDRRRDTRLQDTIIAAYRESALLRKSDSDLPEKERISMNLQDMRESQLMYRVDRMRTLGRPVD